MKLKSVPSIPHDFIYDSPIHLNALNGDGDAINCFCYCSSIVIVVVMRFFSSSSSNARVLAQATHNIQIVDRTMYRKWSVLFHCFGPLYIVYSLKFISSFNTVQLKYSALRARAHSGAYYFTFLLMKRILASSTSINFEIAPNSTNVAINIQKRKMFCSSRRRRRRVAFSDIYF